MHSTSNQQRGRLERSRNGKQYWDERVHDLLQSREHKSTNTKSRRSLRCSCLQGCARFQQSLAARRVVRFSLAFLLSSLLSSLPILFKISICFELFWISLFVWKQLLHIYLLSTILITSSSTITDIYYIFIFYQTNPITSLSIFE